MKTVSRKTVFRKLILVLAGLLAILLLAQPVWATTTTWDVTADGNWSTGNWDNGAPANSYDVQIFNTSGSA